MEIPKPEIDVIFERTLARFNLDMDYVIIHGSKSPFPYFIGQILSSCKETREMAFTEYIIYLKLYNSQKLIPFWNKRKKELIIHEIKNKYNITINLEGFNNYIKTSFVELAKNLGYKIVFEHTM